MLLFNKKSLTQSERKILDNLIFVLQLAKMFINNAKILQL